MPSQHKAPLATAAMVPDTVVGEDETKAGTILTIVVDDLADLPVSEAELGILMTYTSDLVGHCVQNPDAASDNDPPQFE